MDLLEDQLLSETHVHHAMWEEFDRDTKKYKTPKPFTYQTYDDNEFRRSQAQRQPSMTTEAYSLSLETTKQYPFKAMDKITLLDYDVRLVVTYVDYGSKETNWLSRVGMPTLNTNKIIRIHLNKES